MPSEGLQPPQSQPKCFAVPDKGTPYMAKQLVTLSVSLNNVPPAAPAPCTDDTGWTPV